MRGNLAVHCYNKSHFESLVSRNVPSIAACLLGEDAASLLIDEEMLVRWRAMLSNNLLLMTLRETFDALIQEAGRLDGKGFYDAAKQKRVAAAAELEAACKLVGGKRATMVEELTEILEPQLLHVTANTTLRQLSSGNPRLNGVVLEAHRDGQLMTSTVRTKPLVNIMFGFESLLLDESHRVIAAVGPLDTFARPDEGSKANIMIEVMVGTPCSLYYFKDKWRVIVARRFKSFSNPSFNYSSDVLVDESLFWKLFEG